MSVCGGWFSGRCWIGDIDEEKDRIAAQMELFKATNAPCIVYGETGRTIQGDRERRWPCSPRLDEDEIKAYGRKLTTFGEWCADRACRFPTTTIWPRRSRPNRTSIC